MRTWKWFDPEKEPKLKGVAPEVITLLDIARERTVEEDGRGTPFYVTSGRRSAEQNAALRDSASRSAHIPRFPSEFATGVDLACSDGRQLALMVVGLVIAGFRRIGIYVRRDGSRLVPTHVHADKAPDLPTPAFWIQEEL